jgi:hypothetical protein
MIEEIKNVPKYAKYSIAVMPIRDTEQFIEKPNPNWHKRDILVPEKDITRLFTELQQTIGKEVKGPTRFVPAKPRGIVVYFNPNDSKSLYIVVEDEKIGDDYAKENRIPKPFNAPKEYRYSRCSRPNSDF